MSNIITLTDTQGASHEVDFDNLGEHFYNIDNLTALKQMPDKCIDLALIDPPYGIGESGKKNDTRGKLAAAKTYKPYEGEDKEPPSIEFFDELRRVSKNQVIFGANHFISRIPIDSHCWIVWDKDNGETDYADCELAWTSFDSAVRRFKFRWSGMLQENMKNKEFRIHPNQKPVALYCWILQKFAEGGCSVLDTHVGSASSLIACHKMGMNFIGFEKDTYYYNLAKKRLAEETAQTSIFDFGIIRPE